MAVTVKIAGPRADKAVHKEAESIAVDDNGVLVLSAREGRGERVVVVYADGAWLSAEAD